MCEVAHITTVTPTVLRMLSGVLLMHGAFASSHPTHNLSAGVCSLTCRFSNCCIFSLTHVGGRRPAVAGACGLPQGLTPPRVVHGGVTAACNTHNVQIVITTGPVLKS
jgi:hypothetical protein